MNALRHCLFLASCLSITLLLVPPAFASVAEDCVEDLNYLPLFLLRNDAGARDRLSRGGGGDLSHAFGRAKNRAAKADTEAECSSILNEYLSVWRSGHLAIQSLEDEEQGRNIEIGNGADDARPSIRLLSDNTVLVTIPSFHPRAGRQLQNELMKQRNAIAARDNWIIDVRRNHGGSDIAYQPLLPWLLADDIVEVQLAFLATDANVESTLLACELYSPGDETCIEFMKPIVESMQKAKSGSFVGTDDHEIAYIQIPDSPYRQPSRVAILVGEDCVSSCEQFLLTARQSFSVKLLGRNTQGNLDYSNLRPHLLPSEKRQLLYATSRSFRLPDSPVDEVGVMPDIYLTKPANEKEWEEEVARVKNWLEGGSLAPLELLE